jgi:nitrite reductase/ring-hydroxylating ferredoxin subunit
MVLRSLEQLTQELADGSPPWGQKLERAAESLQAYVMKQLERTGDSGSRVADALHGTWLGHALHPALILAPAGSWLTAAVLDGVGNEDGARTAIGFGILSALPAAASGLVDWGYTESRSRRLGLMHAALNSAALTCYTASWLARRSGHGGLGVTLSTVGLGLVSTGAYLGGEISYTLGFGINRNAWSPEVEDLSDKLDDFQEVAAFDDLREGRVNAATLTIDGEDIPLILLLRGREVLALNGTCSHMGAPLAEGRIVEEWCVECPWHGSRFDFRDGEAVKGPAAYPQPRFETRIRDGKVEARLARLAQQLDGESLRRN